MKRYAIPLLTAFVLAACGSGGGGSSSSTPATPATPTPTPTAKSIDGVREDLKNQVTAAKTENIHGQLMNIAELPEGWVNIDLGNNMQLRGYNLPYLATGYAVPKDVNIDEYGRVYDERVDPDAFDIIGLETKYSNKPTTGSAMYNGVSFGANSEGKLALTANFVDNTIEGRLYDRTALKDRRALPEITLEKGDIHNINDVATYEGVARATIDGNLIRTRYFGGFGGPNAEESAGVVLDDRELPYEAFIGKK